MIVQKMLRSNGGHMASQLRYYSDFLSKLPRVGGGGISRFAKKPVLKPDAPVSSKPVNKVKKQNTQPQKPQGGNQPTSGHQPASGNRFANIYQNGKKPNQQNKPRSEADIEREKASAYSAMKKNLQRKDKNVGSSNKNTFASKRKATSKKSVTSVKINIPPFISVSNLATIMNVPLNDVFKKLEGLGYEDMRHNYILDRENASLIADEYNFEAIISENEYDDLFPAPVKEELLKERPPVVTIMGHVDHGKTTILDYLRKSSIVDQEFGGITQHIGAFSVFTPISNKKITFLDTPGHAAFLKMRERGAIITDIVILVVAADDSVMPQTIEAIKHAKKSGVPIIVAINKCDKHDVKIDKVLADLANHEIDIEDYGGETQTVKVSGKTGLNMDKLEEAVITLSEMSEFKAETTNIQAEGWIIESQVVKGMGTVATVLVRRGTLKNGDIIVAGNTYCKIKGMKDEHGKLIKAAGPSTPVQVWGWKELPDGGDQILQAKTEKIAKEVCQNRITRQKEIQASRDIESINQKRQEEIEESKRQDKINQMKAAGLDASELEGDEAQSAIQVNYMIKSDVFGSAEAIKESINGMGNDEVKSVVVTHEAGPPTDSDIDLAKTLNATIFCFNIKVPKPIAVKADKERVEIIEHNIIYRLIEDVTNKLQSHLKPRIEIKTLGEVEVKDVFVVTIRKSKVRVAGCKVDNGAIKKSSRVKVLRNNEVVFDGGLSSLKYVKDDIAEARKGNECGITFDHWDKFEAGDKIEVYETIEHQRFL